MTLVSRLLAKQLMGEMTGHRQNIDPESMDYPYGLSIWATKLEQHSPF